MKRKSRNLEQDFTNKFNNLTLFDIIRSNEKVFDMIAEIENLLDVADVDAKPAEEEKTDNRRIFLSENISASLNNHPVINLKKQML